MNNYLPSIHFQNLETELDSVGTFFKHSVDGLKSRIEPEYEKAKSCIKKYRVELIITGLLITNIIASYHQTGQVDLNNPAITRVGGASLVFAALAGGRYIKRKM